MKKLLAVTLAFAMLLGGASALAAEAPQPSKLVIASSTEMSGAFFTDLWGNNSSDLDVRGLIHGYSTVAWLKSGEYAVDTTVVRSLNTSLSNRGYKIYEFTLNPDLQWNDGTPLTAKDYVFSVLLQNGPQIAELGASNQQMGHVIGHAEYASGRTNVLAGVRLLGDSRFTLLVDGEYLPYFYELMLVNVTPYPMHVIAPGVEVRDDGAGAYLSESFTAELLRGTLQGDTGYVQAPKVTCGPYSLVRYDAQNHVAQFEKNPYYLGNFEGRKPEIEQLEFRYVAGADMAEALRSGEVDILNKVSDGALINQALALRDSGQVSSVNYLRAGFGFLAFACEEGPTSDVNVRKAIAMCMDQDAFCQEVFQGYALPVYGFYGMGQWMASQDTERLEELNVYGYDPVGAVRLLQDGGWTLNEYGKRFEAGVDTVRCKSIRGVLTPLEINWAKTDGAGAARLERMLVAASEQLGFRLNVTELGFAEALTHYYRQTEREYNLFNMATNFHHVFDPYYTYNTEDAYQGIYNTSGLRDERLMTLARRMRAVETGDADSYLDQWYDFQQRWIQLMPVVPLYSNVYFDFFRADLYGYDINTFWGWGASILYATFTPPAETEAGVVIQP